MNWELYRNPVTGISEDVYKQMIGNGKPPEEGDVIFVRRGSYRIGTVAMASPRDSKVLLTKELLTFRVSNEENEYGVTPFYLLAMLSSAIVQEQIKYFVFIDTTLPNIGNRWKHIILPIHKSPKNVQGVSEEVKQIIHEKWSAQEKIDTLQADLGKIVT